MQKSLQFDYIFKYILVGEASVGKSTILNRFIHDTFTSEVNPTMGVEFGTKLTSVRGRKIKVQVWDTAGQESFRTITRAYYRNAIGVILVYDLSSPATLKSIDSWLAEINDNSNPLAQVLLVGNKTDLLSTAPPKQSPKPQLRYLTTSAKNNQNIDRIFNSLTEKVLAKIDEGKIPVEGTQGVKKGVPLHNPASPPIVDLYQSSRSARNCCQ